MKNYSQAYTESLILFPSKHTHRNTYNLRKHGEKDPYCALDDVPEDEIQKNYENERRKKRKRQMCAYLLSRALAS